MNRDYCNGFLEVLAIVNSGCNHGSDYTLEELPRAGSLDDSLASYFSLFSTSLVPRQPAVAWNIRTELLPGAWTADLGTVLQRWFFAQEFSPTVDPGTVSEVVENFMGHLRKTVGEANVYRVQVSPPMWYECLWEDLAFDAGSSRWLLHLGFSD